MSGFNEAFKQASTGDDGKQYFVPLTNCPWAFFHRKSVWEEKGYEEPKTLDELVTLAKQMQRTAWSRSPSPTRTAGRRWAPSTS